MLNLTYYKYFSLLKIKKLIYISPKKNIPLYKEYSSSNLSFMRLFILTYINCFNEFFNE